MESVYDPNARSLIILNNKSKSQGSIKVGKTGRYSVNVKTVQQGKLDRNSNQKCSGQIRQAQWSE